MSNIGRKKKLKAQGTVSPKKKYPSIWDLPEKQSIDGSQYLWRELRGLSTMLEWLGGRVKVEEVTVANADKVTDSLNNSYWSNYGDRLNYISEAFVFDDGAALACCTVSTWNGTFASHDTISVKYYALEKK
jgi:hypothetical protein